MNLRGHSNRRSIASQPNGLLDFMSALQERSDGEGTERGHAVQRIARVPRAGNAGDVVKGQSSFGFGLVVTLCLVAEPAAAANGTPIYFLGIPIDFILFGLTLLGVAVFHHITRLPSRLSGLAAITLYKLITGFKTGAGSRGLALHMQHEWVIIANLFLLLMGFALTRKRSCEK